jgi:obg-like ATPase 1
MKQFLEKPPGRNLKCGLVGMTNVGKSSIYNLLASKQVPVENSPFTTIGNNI